MAGIGTAAKNWKDEQGIGEAAYREPQQGIGTPASNQGNNQGIGTPAYHEPAGSIGKPAAHEPQQDIGTPASKSGGQTQQPIKTLEGVSDATRNRLNGLQTGYQPGAAAQNVQQQLQQLQANKPGGYTSAYGAQLQDILNQIQGGGEFKYSIAEDPLMQSLNDYYMQQAKQASMGAQAGATALTGGYGNSAAQMAGSQAYQQAILPMYDKAMDAAQFAYNVHQGKQADRLNQANLLMNLEQMGYGQYRDQMGDYKDERSFLANQYNEEANRDMTRYYNDLDYAMKMAQIENADYRSEQERQEAIRQFQLQYDADQARFRWQKDTDQRDYDRNVLESDRNYAMQQQQLAETIRQFDASLDWDKMNAQQKYAAEIVSQILAKGQMPSEAMLEAAGLSAEDAQKLMAQISGGGTRKTTTNKDESYIDASGRVLQSTPGSTTLGELNGSNDTRTIDELKSGAVLDVGRPGGSLGMTPAAWLDIQDGKVQTTNSAKEFAENLRDQHNAAAEAKTPLRGTEQQSYYDYVKKLLGME